MPLRLRSAGGGSVLLKPPVALAADMSMEVPGYEGAKLLTDRTPGTVLQVISSTKTDALVLAYGTTVWTAISGLSATITPRNATNKILVLLNVGINGTGGVAVARGRVTRSGSVINVGDAASNRPRSIGQVYHYTPGSSEGGYTQGFMTSTFLDSPNTTSAITYQFEAGGDSGGTLYINRTQNDRDGAYVDARGVSSITLMEIAA